jgi:hypothetical protein
MARKRVRRDPAAASHAALTRPVNAVDITDMTAEEEDAEYDAIHAVAAVVMRLLTLRDFTVSRDPYPDFDEYFAFLLCKALGGTDRAASVRSLAGLMIITLFSSACTGGITEEGIYALQRYILNGTDHADLCSNGLMEFSMYLQAQEVA